MILYKMKKKKEKKRFTLKTKVAGQKNLENHNIIFSLRMCATMATRG